MDLFVFFLLLLAFVAVFVLGVAYSDAVKKREQAAVAAVEEKAAPVFKAYGDIKKEVKSVL